MILLDTVIASTKTGIVTSLLAHNVTSFLIQNSAFMSVGTAVLDRSKGQTLMEGGSLVKVESWGFGRVSTSISSTFYNGATVPAMNRSSALTTNNGQVVHNFFQHRRPAYTDIPASQIIDVKAQGAVGDGRTDDTGVLNNILQQAAKSSSVVFFPFGVYLIKDTLHIPVGSRIIGQAWSQIMATGSKFQDESHSRVAVRVGNPGDGGVLEIQGMLFTVSGPTVGAVLMEWNVHQLTQGSAGLWGMYGSHSISGRTDHFSSRFSLSRWRCHRLRLATEGLSQGHKQNQCTVPGRVALTASHGAILRLSRERMGMDSGPRSRRECKTRPDRCLCRPRNFDREPGPYLALRNDFRAQCLLSISNIWGQGRLHGHDPNRISVFPAGSESSCSL